MEIQTSHCLILAPIALCLFVAMRLSLGSTDEAKQSWLLTAVRGGITIMLLTSMISFGARAHWLGLAWLLVLAVFAVILYRKNRRLRRDALLLSAIQAGELSLQDELISRFAAENTGWLRRKARALGRDLSAGVPWPLALEMRGVASGPYEKLALRLRACYGQDASLDPDGIRISETPLRVGSELETLFGRLWMVSWLFVTIPVSQFVLAWILPNIVEIFEEFGLELPVVMQQMSGLSSWLSGVWPNLWIDLIPATLYLAGLFMAVVWLFPSLLQLPGLRWLCSDYYRTLGLLYLSRAIQHESDLVSALERGGQLVPVRFIARTYQQACQRVRNGESVANALLSAGVVRSSELSLFSSSGQQINLEQDPVWGLRQLARWRVERMLSRYSFVVQVIVLSVTILAAAIVSVLGIALISSLATMIESMTRT